MIAVVSRAISVPLNRSVNGSRPRVPRDELRRLMVTVFDELGPDHPLSTRFRRQLAAALY